MSATIYIPQAMRSAASTVISHWIARVLQQASSSLTIIPLSPLWRAVLEIMSRPASIPPPPPPPSPPPPDPAKSAIENALELTPLPDIGPDVFTNTRPLWRPPGARGVYGGAVIAQCLSAAQRTVAARFFVHSMHCYFVLAGAADVPVVYHVERVREGRSFATRTVQAKQRGRCIFLTMLSFVREGSGGQRVLEHSTPMSDVPPPPPLIEGNGGSNGDGGSSSGGGEGPESETSGWPFQSVGLETLNGGSSQPHKKKLRRWIRATGRLSDAGGRDAHLAALAYVSDRLFVGTSWAVHIISSHEPAPSKHADRGRCHVVDRARPAAAAGGSAASAGDGGDGGACSAPGKQHPPEEEEKNANDEKKGEDVEIGMMVSLDHTIYFHDPTGFRADEWMLTEMESPWADDGRGFVTEKIFTPDGRLIASCVQEGVVRLKQGPEAPSRPPSAAKL